MSILGPKQFLIDNNNKITDFILLSISKEPFENKLKNFIQENYNRDATPLMIIQTAVS